MELLVFVWLVCFLIYCFLSLFQCIYECLYVYSLTLRTDEIIGAYLAEFRLRTKIAAAAAAASTTDAPT